ncbi:MAG: RDD family protein [Haliscomenobacter sp.]|uniref:RDD family protein n=1 Tax=Haliscomenobacter sp. TaxID=2717303 RepID=UPI0029BA4900|nr:RDD family protein [Haliscomenobacter sp.]MDX2072531.1 RDD family protein [Haliscomenobacter sp.]
MPNTIPKTTTLNLILSRIAAALLDYCFVIGYAILLFGLVGLLFGFEKMGSMEFSPAAGQLIAFSTLTLPVFLYFFLQEKSGKKATIGKRALRLQVEMINNGSSCTQGILIRTALKLLPWEIAHWGVQWLAFYIKKEMEPPIWVWILLVVPQVVAFFYFVSMLYTRGTLSLYDAIAGTKLVKQVVK